MGKNVETDADTMEGIDSHTDNHRLVDRYNHYKRRHAHYKNLYLVGRKYKPIAGLLLFAFILLVLVYVFNIVLQSSVESNVENLKQQNYKLNRSLEASESRLAEMLQQLGGLQNRHPGLSILDFDRLIPLDAKYARSILLRKSPSGDAVEFQLLLENTGSDPLDPAIFIEWFNYSGETILSNKLAFDRDSQLPTILEPGAFRSVSGVFEPPAATVFFKLRAE